MKYLRSSLVDGKHEIACFHVETATGKREKWRENRGHVVIFAVRVSCIRDAKSLYYHVLTSSVRYKCMYFTDISENRRMAKSNLFVNYTNLPINF